ncbi:esterase / lipase [Rhodotorula toruloides]|uniref:Esterase / lipase n=1 Tax=Rhodotorula toruloides TaxID=5286 RepID=A0A511KAI9_RHOTO|nr:esterase / lipase [Rhodotorula toruloides]
MALWPFSWGSAVPDPSTSPKHSHPASLSSKHVSDPGGAVDPDADAGREAQTALASWAALLEPFKGGQLPVKARTDPSIRQKLVTTAPALWEYLPFLAKQGTSLTKAFLQHHLYGPPKPSWGVELTLFTTFLREVSSYSHLSSLARLRSVLELGSLLPTPKDGIVTPISFRVKRRSLRGILAPYDAQETGQREISGEWVTNKRLWRKMTREWTLDQKGSADEARTKDGANKDGYVCLYLHGGAYYMFSAETHRYLTISVSRYCEARVFAINYRLAPETRFPGQLHDAVSAYMRLTLDLKIPPENIIFAGDSAGGGLCLATLMYLRDEGYPLPAGAILMSPWVDLTMSCESWTTNRPYDYLPNPNTEDDHLHPVKCLLGDSIEQYLTHPYVSPLFGDFTGLPPLLVQAGDAEVLRDEITLLAHKAALAGVRVEHEIFEDCVHVFQAFLMLEASRRAFQSQRVFVRHTLPRLRRKAAAASTSTTTTTSTAPTPETEGVEKGPDEAGKEKAGEGFDFAEVDREVTADAHEVDQTGKAEKRSLPNTPILGRGEADLPPQLALDEDDEEDEDLDADVSSELDRSSEASNTPPVLSPRLDTSSSLSSSSVFRTADGADDGSSPMRVDDEVDTVTPASPAAAPPSSAVSKSGSASSSTGQRSVRPMLRAYASARDLSMSTLRNPPSSAASSPVATAATPKHRSATVAGPVLTQGPGSRSTPTSPRGSIVALQPLSPKPVTERHRPLHARTTSHPEFQQLLKSYIEDGAAPRAKTRVWGAGNDGEEVEVE